MSKFILCCGIAVGILCSVSSWAFSSGPPNNRTGAPGESTCTGCHSSFALNSGNGSLSITVPPNYIPGDSLDLIIDISDPGQQRWGFEITVLDNSNQPVGKLLVAEASRTQISVDGTSGREYIKHTSAGTDNGTSDTGPGWTLRWASPLVPAGDVTFYAAGNAANGNGSSSGDYIYTTSEIVSQTVVACCVGSRGNTNDDPSDAVNISDVTYLTAYLFGVPNGPAPVCTQEGNVNGDPSEAINISDVTYLVAYLFGVPNGPAPPSCP